MMPASGVAKANKFDLTQNVFWGSARLTKAGVTHNLIVVPSAERERSGETNS